MKLKKYKNEEYERMVDKFLFESYTLDHFFSGYKYLNFGDRNECIFDIGVRSEYTIYSRNEINYQKSIELFSKYDHLKDDDCYIELKRLIELSYKKYKEYILKLENDQRFLEYKEKQDFEQILENF
jgi:hypothetical protein